MNELSEIIRDEIRTSGPMRFKRFMELALYHPELGYYTKNVRIGSKSGTSDFCTHPEIYSPFYGHAFGRLVAGMAKQLPSEIIIHEQGAGNGTLAKDILDVIQSEYPLVYERMSYVITDISPLLRRKQEEKLAEHSCVLITAGNALTTEIPLFTGFMISNELPDAFPVDLVVKLEDSFYVVTVEEKDGEFFPCWNVPATEKEMVYLERGGYLPYVVLFEPTNITPKLHEIANELIRVAVPINDDMLSWYDRVTRSLQSGAVITTDYGFLEGRQLLETVCHYGRTLRTYKDGKSNRSLMNPFIEVGERDMTSDVNFGLLTKVGEENQLNTFLFQKEDEIIYRFSQRRVDEGFETLIQAKGIIISSSF